MVSFTGYIVAPNQIRFTPEKYTLTIDYLATAYHKFEHKTTFYRPDCRKFVEISTELSDERTIYCEVKFPYTTVQSAPKVQKEARPRRKSTQVFNWYLVTQYNC